MEVLETEQTDEGITIIKYNLNNLTARQVTLGLHFSAKWIIMSEIKFHSHQPEAGLINQLTVNEQPEENVFHTEDNVVKDSKVLEEKVEFSENDKKEKDKDEPDSVVPITGGGSSQMYVGITIGILSMSVLLLIFTIFFILRKNKHRIFSKHSSKCFYF